MRPIVLTALLCIGAGSQVSAQPSRSAACIADANGRMDFQACADVAPKGSPERALALINLATQAYSQRDFATAVRLYDEAVPPGKQLYSDIRLHAYRGAAYSHVGRTAEALADAKVVLMLLDGEKSPSFPANQPAYDPVEVLATVLGILKQAGDPAFPSALAKFKALPAGDWFDHANRAAALGEVGDYDGALAANAEAMRGANGHPAVLNNACYFSAKAQRAAEGLPYCERAVAAAPKEAAIRDSYATALAALGRCADAKAQLDEARSLDPSAVEYRRTLACAAS